MEAFDVPIVVLLSVPLPDDAPFLCTDRLRMSCAEKVLLSIVDVVVAGMGVGGLSRYPVVSLKPKMDNAFLIVGYFSS